MSPQHRRATACVGRSKRCSSGYQLIKRPSTTLSLPWRSPPESLSRKTRSTPSGRRPSTGSCSCLGPADGNPLFLEEIIRRLIDGGMLVRNGSGWRVAGTLPAALPDTVLAVLGARIDALPASQKRALQEAAVIGRVFWEAPVRQATSDPDVTSSLLALEAKGLVSIHPTSAIAGELEFIFKHALVRDVAYASLPRIRSEERRVG